jgi:hypothetical protein
MGPRDVGKAVDKTSLFLPFLRGVLWSFTGGRGRCGE